MLNTFTIYYWFSLYRGLCWMNVLVGLCHTCPYRRAAPGAIRSTLLHLAESGQTVYPYTLQNSPGCFCPLPCHQETPVTQCHWKPYTLMPSHCSTMFHRWCCMLWIMSWSKPSPYFFFPVILVQVDVNFSRPKNAYMQKCMLNQI